MKQPSIAICALTYKRREGVTRLINGLNELTFGDSPPNVAIVIVDNDPEGSGRQVCEQLAAQSRWPLKYVVEPQRGIAFARNAALDNAGDVEWLCFIDDDEVPDASWLDQLIAAQRAYNADVVGGPVIPYFSEPVADWIIRGEFFNRRRYPAGQQLGHAFTNNVLFRRRILAELDLRFDERWALMGCEDRAFFQRIGMANYKIVWADDAVVTEWIPASRANAAWLVRRHYRVGNSTSFVELDLRPKWRTGPILLAKSGVWFLIGLGLLVRGVFGSKRTSLRGRRAVAYASGLFTGMLGIPFEEYRQTHGV